MAPTSVTVDVARSPSEVFPYVTDPSRFHEWQKGVISGHIAGEETGKVGSRCVTTRRIGFADRPTTAEIIEVSPPRRWSIRGIDGSIRANVDVTVEPLADPARSRVTIAIAFQGHGLGKLLVPLVVRRQAEQEMPHNMRQLKERLESSALAK